MKFSDADLLAFNLCLVDCITLLVMEFMNIYTPFLWVVGVLFPSVAAYLIGCFWFNKRLRKRIPSKQKG